jgi:hypothetical protein
MMFVTVVLWEKGLQWCLLLRRMLGDTFGTTFSTTRPHRGIPSDQDG